MTLTVNSDLNGDSPQFTLTCISTGGPATTVTWTRDSTTTVTEGTVTVLDDPETAQYNHTLTVRGRKPGLYNCTMDNTVSSDSITYTVQGLLSFVCIIPLQIQLQFMDLPFIIVAYPPTELTYELHNGTSIMLMWVPPTLGNTTGYMITINVIGGSRNSVNVTGGNTSNHTLSGLQKGEEYNITIIGVSDHFFSMSVAWEPITLTGIIMCIIYNINMEVYNVFKDEEDTTIEEKATTGTQEEGGTKEEKNSGGENGSIAAGVLTPLILITIITVLALIALLVWKKRHAII